MKVLSVTSECAPLVKTGGLADVAGALPAALASQGVEMATLLPGYPAVLSQIESPRVVKDIDALFGGPARVLKTRLGQDATLFVLDAPHLFDRPGAIYTGPDGWDWPDNPQRFAGLSMAAAMIAADGISGSKKGKSRWQPDVLHLHDWQAGLTPVYLSEMGADGRVGTVLTVHNIAFQGLFPRDQMAALALPDRLYHSDGIEYYGQVSALKAGLVYADRLTTVSPTYATELMRPDFGMGLDGVLRSRAQDFSGILNGIDETVWSPPYGSADGKAEHRRALRKTFDLPETDGPLCVVISRLTAQKGFDLLLEAVPALLDGGGQLALLGSGDPQIENAFLQIAAQEPQVSVRVGYDEALSHRMMEGGDAILVPSRFEPCGLTQLYGLRYGTVPLVTMTGGLADTVIPANAAATAQGVATGFQVFPITAQALASELTKLCAVYEDKSHWRRLQKNAMAQPVGWGASAARYAELYRATAKG